MIIGSTTIREISPLLREVGKRLSREINAVVYTVDEYRGYV